MLEWIKTAVNLPSGLENRVLGPGYDHEGSMHRGELSMHEGKCLLARGGSEDASLDIFCSVKRQKDLSIGQKSSKYSFQKQPFTLRDFVSFSIFDS